MKQNKNAAVVARNEAKQLLIPPSNFAMVNSGVYRSAYPSKKNFSFLATLRLKAIIYLCPEEYAEQNVAFMKENNIQMLHFGIEGNKEPFVDMSPEIVALALQAILDVRNHPVLIHCNKGKHRTGTLVGCLRKMQRWSLTAAFDEYHRFAGTKGRIMDQQYIELFDTSRVNIDQSHKPNWLWY